MPTSSSVNEKPIAHTAGPWIVEPIPPDAHTDPEIHVDEDCAFWIADARPAGEVIALVQITPREPLQAEANGRLIAAAPDLLEAARVFTEAAHDAVAALNGAGLACPSSIAFAAEQARHAIAKAEGRS